MILFLCFVSCSVVFILFVGNLVVCDFFFSMRNRNSICDWSSNLCSSYLWYGSTPTGGSQAKDGILETPVDSSVSNLTNGKASYRERMYIAIVAVY